MAQNTINSFSAQMINYRPVKPVMRPVTQPASVKRSYLTKANILRRGCQISKYNNAWWTNEIIGSLTIDVLSDGENSLVG